MGSLVLVASPIGNLGDISQRALDTLAAADLIACEDTRHSGLLLHHFGIHKPLISYYQHNQLSRAPEILAALAGGQTVALLSDAGMPGISDPGAELVAAAIAENHSVSMVPGPSAFTMALVLSGLPTEKFVFEGFLPRQGRLKALQALQQEPRTMVFYEAPHRLLATLKDLFQAFGKERPMAVARELTKKFEEINRGSIGEMLELYTTKPPKGEFCLVVGGASPIVTAPSAETLAQAMQELLAAGVNHKEAAKIISEQFGISTKEAYRIGLAYKQNQPI